MAGLDPAIHAAARVSLIFGQLERRMAGSSPAMTS